MKRQGGRRSPPRERLRTAAQGGRPRSVGLPTPCRGAVEAGCRAHPQGQPSTCVVTCPDHQASRRATVKNSAAVKFGQGAVPDQWAGLTPPPHQHLRSTARSGRDHDRNRQRKRERAPDVGVSPSQGLFSSGRTDRNLRPLTLFGDQSTWTRVQQTCFDLVRSRDRYSSVVVFRHGHVACM